MVRAHCYRPVLDPNGNVLSDLIVRVYEPGTTSVISEPVYLDSVTTAASDQPLSFADGVINFYLDVPRRVRIGVRKGVNPEQYFEDVDIVASGIESADQVTFAPAGDLTSTNVQAAIEEVYDKALTQAEADALYAPIPQPVAIADPETGAPTTSVPKFTLQTVVAGDLVVSTNLVKPGLRVPQEGKSAVIIARVEEAPVGADIVVQVERWNAGALANTVGTVTIPAGQTVGVEVLPTPLVDWAKGDLMKFPCTQVGSTTPGADILLSVDFQ